MFEEHKAKKAAKDYAAALVSWQTQRAAYSELLNLAQTYGGGEAQGIMLKSGETAFYTITGVSLVEERRGQGHYQGGSTGVSIPVGSIGGRSVRYRVGATRGHYVQAPPVPTAIDSGTMVITNQRVIFQGAKQTRECAFAKLVGFQHDDVAGCTTLSVSNRLKATTLHYGGKLSPNVDFYLDLALAHFRGTVPQLVTQLQQELADVDAHRPTPPPGQPT